MASFRTAGRPTTGIGPVSPAPAANVALAPPPSMAHPLMPAMTPVMAAPAAAPAPVRYQDPQEHNPTRKLALWFALGLILIRISSIHEILTWQFGVNLYLLYIFGPPAILGVLACGGLQRTIRGDNSRIAIFWLAFVAWMILATPFSTWRGSSVQLLLKYVRFELLMMFVVAGLILTWREFRQLLLVMVGVGFLAIATSSLMAEVDSRVKLEFEGTIANSNDYAAHLLFCSPFLILAALSPSRAKLIRLAALLAAGFGFLLILRTGSRGAAISLGVGALFVLLRGTQAMRAVVLLSIPVAVLAILTLVPERTLRRLMSVVESETVSAELEEAMMSSRMRSQLFRKSLWYTLTHPILGVGPGQFSTYEGNESREEGRRGMWHETHNAYTQVSSESGLPALIFYLGGIIASYRRLSQIRRRAALFPETQEVALTAFCIMLSLVMFGFAINFLTVAYRPYLPFLAGMVIAFSASVYREFPQLREAPRGFPLAPATPAATGAPVAMPMAGFPRQTSSR